MMAAGWLTHLATNGAGTIHDWEYAWLGASTESVEQNVATGTFGSWHETATNIHLALLAGALDGLGYGRSLGRFILEDGAIAARSPTSWPTRSRPSPGIRSPPPAPSCCGRSRVSGGRPGGSRSSTDGNTRRSWPRRSATACR